MPSRRGRRTDKKRRTKRKHTKHRRIGGLGGPGGRGGRRRALRPVKGGVRGEQLDGDLLRLTARDMAVELKTRAEKADGAGTAYRKAMSTISDYANRHSRTLLPETRRKLAAAKDVLRDLFGEVHQPKGKGGPGAIRRKPKAQSRRHSRTDAERPADRQSSRRARNANRATRDAGHPARRAARPARPKRDTHRSRASA